MCRQASGKPYHLHPLMPSLLTNVASEIPCEKFAPEDNRRVTVSKSTRQLGFRRSSAESAEEAGLLPGVSSLICSPSPTPPVSVDSGRKRDRSSSSSPDRRPENNQVAPQIMKLRSSPSSNGGGRDDFDDEHLSEAFDSRVEVHPKPSSAAENNFRNNFDRRPIAAAGSSGFRDPSGRDPGSLSVAGANFFSGAGLCGRGVRRPVWAAIWVAASLTLVVCSSATAQDSPQARRGNFPGIRPPHYHRQGSAYQQYLTPGALRRESREGDEITPSIAGDEHRHLFRLEHFESPAASGRAGRQAAVHSPPSTYFVPYPFSGPRLSSWALSPLIYDEPHFERLTAGPADEHEAAESKSLAVHRLENPATGNNDGDDEAKTERNKIASSSSKDPPPPASPVALESISTATNATLENQAPGDSEAVESNLEPVIVEARPVFPGAPDQETNVIPTEISIPAAAARENKSDNKTQSEVKTEEVFQVHSFTPEDEGPAPGNDSSEASAKPSDPPANKARPTQRKESFKSQTSIQESAVSTPSPPPPEVVEAAEKKRNELLRRSKENQRERSPGIRTSKSKSSEVSGRPENPSGKQEASRAPITRHRFSFKSTESPVNKSASIHSPAPQKLKKKKKKPSETREGKTLAIDSSETLSSKREQRADASIATPTENKNKNTDEEESLKRKLAKELAKLYKKELELKKSQLSSNDSQSDVLPSTQQAEVINQVEVKPDKDVRSSRLAPLTRHRGTAARLVKQSTRKSKQITANSTERPVTASPLWTTTVLDPNIQKFQKLKQFARTKESIADGKRRKRLQKIIATRGNYGEDSKSTEVAKVKEAAKSAILSNSVTGDSELESRQNQQSSSEDEASEPSLGEKKCRKVRKGTIVCRVPRRKLGPKLPDSPQDALPDQAPVVIIPPQQPPRVHVSHNEEPGKNVIDAIHNNFANTIIHEVPSVGLSPEHHLPVLELPPPGHLQQGEVPLRPEFLSFQAHDEQLFPGQIFSQPRPEQEVPIHAKQQTFSHLGPHIQHQSNHHGIPQSPPFISQTTPFEAFVPETTRPPYLSSYEGWEPLPTPTVFLQPLQEEGGFHRQPHQLGPFPQQGFQQGPESPPLHIELSRPPQSHGFHPPHSISFFAAVPHHQQQHNFEHQVLHHPHQEHGVRPPHPDQGEPNYLQHQFQNNHQQQHFHPASEVDTQAPPADLLTPVQDFLQKTPPGGIQATPDTYYTIPGKGNKLNALTNEIHGHPAQHLKHPHQPRPGFRDHVHPQGHHQAFRGQAFQAQLQGTSLHVTANDDDDHHHHQQEHHPNSINVGLHHHMTTDHHDDEHTTKATGKPVTNLSINGHQYITNYVEPLVVYYEEDSSANPLNAATPFKKPTSSPYFEPELTQLGVDLSATRKPLARPPLVPYSKFGQSTPSPSLQPPPFRVHNEQSELGTANFENQQRGKHPFKNRPEDSGVSSPHGTDEGRFREPHLRRPVVRPNLNYFGRPQQESQVQYQNEGDQPILTPIPPQLAEEAPQTFRPHKPPHHEHLPGFRGEVLQPVLTPVPQAHHNSFDHPKQHQTSQSNNFLSAQGHSTEGSARQRPQGDIYQERPIFVTSEAATAEHPHLQRPHPVIRPEGESHQDPQVINVVGPSGRPHQIRFTPADAHTHQTFAQRPPQSAESFKQQGHHNQQGHNQQGPNQQGPNQQGHIQQQVHKQQGHTQHGQNQPGEPNRPRRPSKFLRPPHPPAPFRFEERPPVPQHNSNLIESTTHYTPDGSPHEISERPPLRFKEHVHVQHSQAQRPHHAFESHDLRPTKQHEEDGPPVPVYRPSESQSFNGRPHSAPDIPNHGRPHSEHSIHHGPQPRPTQQPFYDGDYEVTTQFGVEGGHPQSEDFRGNNGEFAHQEDPDFFRTPQQQGTHSRPQNQPLNTGFRPPLTEDGNNLSQQRPYIESLDQLGPGRPQIRPFEENRRPNIPRPNPTLETPLETTAGQYFEEETSLRPPGRGQHERPREQHGSRKPFDAQNQRKPIDRPTKKLPAKNRPAFRLNAAEISGQNIIPVTIPTFQVTPRPYQAQGQLREDIPPTTYRPVSRNRPVSSPTATATPARPSGHAREAANTTPLIPYISAGRGRGPSTPIPSPLPLNHVVQDTEVPFLGIPGTPGKDYPLHGEIPETSFACRNHEFPGYYADIESGCQAFHFCYAPHKTAQSFLCPNGTLFNQKYFVCDWWYNVRCGEAEAHYSRNADLFLPFDPGYAAAPAGGGGAGGGASIYVQAQTSPRIVGAGSSLYLEAQLGPRQGRRQAAGTGGYQRQARGLSEGTFNDYRQTVGDDYSLEKFGTVKTRPAHVPADHDNKTVDDSSSTETWDSRKEAPNPPEAVKNNGTSPQDSVWLLTKNKVSQMVQIKHPNPDSAGADGSPAGLGERNIEITPK